MPRCGTHFTKDTTVLPSKREQKEVRIVERLVKRLVLLAVLTSLAIGTAAVTSVTGVLEGFVIVPEEKGVPSAVSTKVSQERRADAEAVALADPRVKAMLEGADGYRT